MKCPFCGDQESKVVDSRHSEDGLSIRRRRECLACQRRFTTYEIVESLPIIVVKRDGSRQGFDRNKIVNSMVRAFDKRQIEAKSWIGSPPRSNRPFRTLWSVRSVPIRSAKWLWSASNPLTKLHTFALHRFTAVSRTCRALSTRSTPSWIKNKER